MGNKCRLCRLFRDGVQADQFYGLIETAGFLGVSRETVRRMATSGKIRFTMVGKTRKILGAVIIKLRGSGA